MAGHLWALINASFCQRRRSTNGVQVDDKSTDGSSSPREASQVNLDPGAPIDGAAALEGTAEELKGKANEFFARGETKDAVKYWAEARKRAQNQAGCEELTRSIDANLALGHLRLQAWGKALQHAEDALAAPGPQCVDSSYVKVLHRRTLALAGLKRWEDAEKALQEFEAAGGAKSIAEQLRIDWQRATQRSKRAQSERVASAWGAEKPQESDSGAGSTQWPDDELWSTPKLEWTACFDLRCDGICWKESEDFDDKVWDPDGVRGRKAEHYPMALPMTIAAAAALARHSVVPEVTLHVLQGLKAPMVQDWNTFLSRFPSIRALHIVYINVFGDGVEDGSDPLHPPRGCLTKPVEEARVDDRVAKIARFTGSYSEFLRAAAAELDLNFPWLAVLADVPLACGGDAAEERLALIMDALVSLAARKVPIAVTAPAQAKDRLLRAPAQRTMATLRLLGARQRVPWQWNRFTVTSGMFRNKERDKHGQQYGTYIGAYAVLGVVTLADNATLRRTPKQILEMLAAKRVPEEADDDNGEKDEAEEEEQDDAKDTDAAVASMIQSPEFQKQLAAFRKKMQKEGRPTGDQMTREEQHRQGMEFARWRATADRSEWDDEQCATVEEVDDDGD